MSSNGQVICLPRNAKTRRRCFRALICALIERDRSPATLLERITMLEVYLAVELDMPLPESVDHLPFNARNALVSGTYIFTQEACQSGAVDRWLDRNWRGLTHPEEFPMVFGLNTDPDRTEPTQAKTSIDQRNHLSYVLTQLDDEKLQEAVEFFEKRSPEECISEPTPPF